MANVAASINNQATPYNIPPPEAFTTIQGADEEEEEEHFEDEQPIIVDDEDTPYDVAPVRKRFSSSTRNVLGAVFVVIISYFLMQVGGPPPEYSKPQLTSFGGEPPCFFDFPPLRGGAVPPCGDDGVPCPEGGICRHGKLIDCPSSFYQISEFKGECVLTERSTDTLASLTELLHEWSVGEQCGWGSLPMLFKYSKLQLAKPMDLATNPLEISILENEFITEHRDDGLYIGLSEDYPLRVPLWCRVTKFVKGALGFFGSLFVVWFHSLLSVMYACLSAYPIFSLVGLVVLLIVKRGRDYRAYRSKLVRDIAQVRLMTYELLQENSSQAHVALHIRDEIAMTRYPDSKLERQYLIKDVWPRVVPDFQQDNRVRKSKKVIEGKPRDVWQWVAAASTKKKANIASA
jgi:hypothetical protein